MTDLDAWLDVAFREWTNGAFTPFHWQRRAFHDLIAGTLPDAVDIPTGCGKTSILALWILAFAAQRIRYSQNRLPRRLVWVVHRRTVVDQTTEVALDVQRLIKESATGSPWADVRETLAGECAYPLTGVPTLPVSTIRGALAEDPTWRVDPARPAIVIGTVDKLGSRLLFQGYGDGRWARSFHTGLLGTDTWWLFDEAQLVPAFAENLRRIARLRAAEPALAGVRKLHITPVSATLTAGANNHVWRVLQKDNDAAIAERMNAAKAVYPAKEWGSSSPSAAQLAHFAHTLASGDDVSRKKLKVEPGSGRRVVVFARSPEFASEVANQLIQTGYEPNHTVGLLTGQLRGYERDRLAGSPVFARFKLAKDLDDGTAHILVCTSAGEVGVDFSADHALIESCHLDSLIQRLGRVNRYGKTESTIWLFEAPQRADSGKLEQVEVSDNESVADDTEEAATVDERTDGEDVQRAEPSARGAKSQLPRVSSLMVALSGSKKNASASPAKLAKVWVNRNPELVLGPPSFARIDEEVLSILSATSFNEIPDGISLDLYLHGERSEPPEVDVIWRAEVDLLSHDGIEPAALGQAIDRMGIRQAEFLRLPMNRLLNWLRSVPIDRAGPAILVRLRGKWTIEGPRDLQKMRYRRANDALIVLPPDIGGLGRFGEFSPTVLERVTDVFDLAASDAHRAVEVDEELLGFDAETGEWAVVNEGAINRLGRFNLGEAQTCFLRFCLDLLRMAGQGDFSLLSETRMLLSDHHQRALRGAELILSKLDLPKDDGNSLGRGTGHHDDGKRHPLWQRAVSGSEKEPLAKAPRMNGRLLNGYRHELGSLLTAAFGNDDLALHSVAVHHGWGRPHFLPRHYDARYAEKTNQKTAIVQLERFRMLERRYGRWTLAYLETLLKCADIYGSLKDSHA